MRPRISKTRLLSMIAVLVLVVGGLAALAQLPRPMRVPEDMLVHGGVPKDGIPALTHPWHVAAQSVGDLPGASRVIGIVLNGEARAYPLNILVLHECVNDTVGGMPIAVTYCPLCDSAYVFDRRVGAQVRESGISGLLCQSNVVLYDRQATPREESLWSQVEMRAIAGPAAARGRLRVRTRSGSRGTR